jgi:tRNA G18 (ribose-2'-O)-methylase SpoU
MKLNAKELRNVDEKEIAEKLKTIKRRPMYFILENIYDTYNIGGLFRLADALAIEKIYICGESEIPPNHRIKKASIGTYKVVPWEYCKTAAEAIDKFRNSARSIFITRESHPDVRRGPLESEKIARASFPKVIAVEQAKNSIPYQEADYSFPIALIFGNESYGVTEETLKLADEIVEIPMWGINKSLNVIVSASIVSYWAVTGKNLKSQNSKLKTTTKN